MSARIPRIDGTHFQVIVAVTVSRRFGAFEPTCTTSVHRGAHPRDAVRWLDVGVLADAQAIRDQPRRYIYLGDALTAPELVGAACDPVLRSDGKCIVGGSKHLVRFNTGAVHVVLRRRLRRVHPPGGK